MAYLAFLLMALGLFLVLFSLFTIKPNHVTGGMSGFRVGHDANILLPVRESLSPGEKPNEDDLPFVLKGILYFNPNRAFSPRPVASLRGLTALSETHRMGRASMVMDKAGFTFHCGNASYKYTTSELDRIEFHTRGLLLIPIDGERSTVVFITEKPEEIRSFIKKHSALRVS